eukprot:TRINITY_DN56605_c0_g1_i1.p2 TRINITY_DN56605_c0_g1~~TRINITY_DN56605_c0_g1_i1.p2  ORF type:complete len:247 (+),score=69.85 TRINITY_DN56605_c0_g1_i1:56-796(+)
MVLIRLAKRARKEEGEEEDADTPTTQRADKAKGTGRGKGKKQTDDTDRLLELVSKLTLQTSHTARVLKSITMQTWILKTDTPIVKAAIKAGQDYASHVKDMDKDKREEEVGLAHVHILSAIMDAIVVMEKEKGNTKMETENIRVAKGAALPLQNFIDSCAGKNPQQVSTHVHNQCSFVRTSKMFKKPNKAETTRLELHAIPGTDFHTNVMPVISTYLKETCAGRLTEGVAPRGYLEHEIQKILDRK